MPTGNQIKAARSLLGWQQKDLAAKAGLHPGVMNRMEQRGKQRVTGMVKNIEAVLDALEKGGVEFTENGVELIKKARR